MKKVLVVDPSKSFTQFASLALTRLGYQVVGVPDGETALYLLHAEPYDLVVTETSLPGMDGIEICRRIRGSARGAEIRLVAASRMASAKLREAALLAGCDEFLPKPVSARTLHEVMQRLLPFSPRRRALRARMTVTATVLREASKENLRTLSVGEAGLFLHKPDPDPVGSRLFIALPLPNLRNALTFTGVVAYSLPEPRGTLLPGMGVRFTDLDPNASTLLTHYVENYLAGFVRGVPGIVGSAGALA